MAHWQTEMEAEQEMADGAIDQVLAELARGRNARQNQAQALAKAAAIPQGHGQQAGDNNKPKAISDLRPNILTPSATPEELTAWIKDLQKLQKSPYLQKTNKVGEKSDEKSRQGQDKYRKLRSFVYQHLIRKGRCYRCAERITREPIVTTSLQRRLAKHAVPKATS